MDSRATVLLLCVAVLAGSFGPTAEARRMLSPRDWGDDGDPTGTKVLSQARSLPGSKGSVRRAVTPEAAEASANSEYKALFRNEIGAKNSVAFAMTPATVEADPSFTTDQANKAQRLQVVKPRARSAIDTPWPSSDLASGSAQMPTMAMGTTTASQTFEGATSIAASDAVFVNAMKGTMAPLHLKQTEHSNSMLTSYTKAVPKASKAGSFGTTAQTAASVAYAGPGDGRITLAQAHEVSAIAQASQSTYDQWQLPPQEDPRYNADNGFAKERFEKGK